MVQRGRWVGTTLRHGQLRQVDVRGVWVGGCGTGGWFACLVFHLALLLEMLIVMLVFKKPTRDAFKSAPSLKVGGGTIITIKSQLLSRRKCWLPSCADGNILVCFARRLDPLGAPGVRCAPYALTAGGGQRCVCRALHCQSYFPHVEGTCWSPVPSLCQEECSGFAHR